MSNIEAKERATALIMGQAGLTFFKSDASPQTPFSQYDFKKIGAKHSEDQNGHHYATDDCP